MADQEQPWRIVRNRSRSKFEEMAEVWQDDRWKWTSVLPSEAWDWIESAVNAQPKLVQALERAYDRFGAIRRLSAWSDSTLEEAVDEARQMEAGLKIILDELKEYGA